MKWLIESNGIASSFRLHAKKMYLFYAVLAIIVPFATTAVAQSTLPPTPNPLQLTASSSSVVTGSTVQISWQVNNATSCVGSAVRNGSALSSLAGWTDSTSVNSSRAVTFANLSGVYQLSLACSNDAGASSGSVTINVLNDDGPFMTLVPEVTESTPAQVVIVPLYFLGGASGYTYSTDIKIKNMSQSSTMFAMHFKEVENGREALNSPNDGGEPVPGTSYIALAGGASITLHAGAQGQASGVTILEKSEKGACTYPELTSNLDTVDKNNSLATYKNAVFTSAKYASPFPSDGGSGFMARTYQGHVEFIAAEDIRPSAAAYNHLKDGDCESFQDDVGDFVINGLPPAGQISVDTTIHGPGSMYAKVASQGINGFTSTNIFSLLGSTSPSLNSGDGWGGILVRLDDGSVAKFHEPGDAVSALLINQKLHSRLSFHRSEFDFFGVTYPTKNLYTDAVYVGQFAVLPFSKLFSPHQFSTNNHIYYDGCSAVPWNFKYVLVDGGGDWEPHSSDGCWTISLFSMDYDHGKFFNTDCRTDSNGDCTADYFGGYIWFDGQGAEGQSKGVYDVELDYDSKENDALYGNVGYMDSDDVPPVRLMGQPAIPFDLHFVAPWLKVENVFEGMSMKVGVQSKYKITVTNQIDANDKTTAVATVKEVLDPSLELGRLPSDCSSIGNEVTCTIPAGLGASKSVSFDLPVTPTAANATGIVATADLVGGGDPDCAVLEGYRGSNCHSESSRVVVEAAIAATEVFLSGPSSAVPNQMVTLVATVAATTASGSVEFVDADSSSPMVCNGQSDGVVAVASDSHAATCDTSFATAGTANVQAKYLGDDNFEPADSNVLTLTVAEPIDVSMTVDAFSLEGVSYGYSVEVVNAGQTEASFTVYASTGYLSRMQEGTCQSVASPDDPDKTVTTCSAPSMGSVTCSEAGDGYQCAVAALPAGAKVFLILTLTGASSSTVSVDGVANDRCRIVNASGSIDPCAN